MASSTTLHLAALKGNVWSPMGLCSPHCREHTRLPPAPLKALGASCMVWGIQQRNECGDEVPGTP